LLPTLLPLAFVTCVDTESHPFAVGCHSHASDACGRSAGYVLDLGRRKIQSARPVHSPRATNQTAASRHISECELGAYVTPVFGA
jgi:hypothetical protein